MLELRKSYTLKLAEMFVETQKQAEASVKQAAASVQQAAQTSQNGMVPGPKPATANK